MLHLFVLVPIFLGLGASSTLQIACADTDVLGPSADGLQWHKGQDPLISWLYKEWWFFALYDEKADIAGAFGYSVRFVLFVELELLYTTVRNIDVSTFLTGSSVIHNKPLVNQIVVWQDSGGRLWPTTQEMR